MQKKIFLVGILFFLHLNSRCQDEVKIGTQIWMSKNLNVDRFRNGDVIPEARTPEEWVKACEEQRPAWCFYNYDSTLDPTYGKLYNWYAMMDPRGLAPEGWHIPTSDEWETLRSFIGRKPKNGKKLQSTSGWDKDKSGTNEMGFNALPMPNNTQSKDGDYDSRGKNKKNKMFASWWTSTPSLKEYGNIAALLGEDFTMGRGCKKCGIHIRCVNDR
jgi:uncharacterized protein (TIGR02145 family)